MTFTPDIRQYQQLVYGGVTGNVDCTAWGGAICAAAHSNGVYHLSGRSIRLRSNEPVPDRTSPGLNVQQVDDAVRSLTSGRVNFDTPWPGRFGRVTVRDRAIDGQWVNLAVKRGVLVARGFGGSSRFPGAHDITIHARPTDLAPVIGDPLVPYYYTASWDAVLDAAQAVTGSGNIFASFTRDTTPDYVARVQPRAGAEFRVFYHYLLNSGGRITGRKRHRTMGFSASCTPPRTHTGTLTRELVQLTSGSRKGWYISATYAQEA